MGTETAPDGITVIGGKTGTTNDAGYCLVLLSNNAAGDQIISIVMKADCRNNLYYYMRVVTAGHKLQRTVHRNPVNCYLFCHNYTDL